MVDRQQKKREVGVNYQLIFDLIHSKVKQCHNSRAPFVIGISGKETAGKTWFAEQLRADLHIEYNVNVIHLDNFFKPTAIRYAGSDEVDNYLNKSIDFELLEERVLVPLTVSKRLIWKANLFELQTDQFSYSAEFDVGPGDIAILEGVFLFRKAWRQYFDLRVLLTITDRVAVERGIARDTVRFGHDVRRRYEMKYLRAQAVHSIVDDPEGHAHVVVNNNDLDRPSVTLIR